MNPAPEVPRFDPRGWTVVDNDRHPIGVVTDIVVDPDPVATPYFEVALDVGWFGLRDADRHVLVPFSAAPRDGDLHRLVVGRLTPRCVENLIDARTRQLAEFWRQWWVPRRATLEELRVAIADLPVADSAATS